MASSSASCTFTVITDHRDHVNLHDNLHQLRRLAVWRVLVSALVSINIVNLHRARLVLGWVTVAGVQFPVRENILVYNQLPSSTQPGHPSVGRRNEYQPQGSDAVRLGSKGRYVLWVAQVKLCDPLAMTGYIWASLAMGSSHNKCPIILTLLALYTSEDLAKYSSKSRYRSFISVHLRNI